MSETMISVAINSATVRSNDLVELLTGVSTHAHKGEESPILNSVLMGVEDGNIYAVATDRYRLIEGKRVGEGKLDPVLIRLSDIKRILSLIKDKGRFPLPVTINHLENGGLVSVAIGGDSLTLNACDGAFPPYEHIFPTGETVAIPMIQFNPALFADYSKIAGKGIAVRVRFYGENKAMAIDLGEGWRALLMPMRKA